MAAKIRKAIITAAGLSGRRIPLQSLTNESGDTKPAIAIIIEEMLAAGIEQVGLVVSPADRAAFTTVLSPYAKSIFTIEQPVAGGYGHAVLCGRDFVGSESFLLQVSDHLYVSAVEKSCTRQLLDLAEAEGCAVSAVQATHERHLPF